MIDDGAVPDEGLADLDFRDTLAGAQDFVQNCGYYLVDSDDQRVDAVHIYDTIFGDVVDQIPASKLMSDNTEDGDWARSHREGHHLSHQDRYGMYMNEFFASNFGQVFLPEDDLLDHAGVSSISTDIIASHGFREGLQYRWMNDNRELLPCKCGADPQLSSAVMRLKFASQTRGSIIDQGYRDDESLSDSEFIEKHGITRETLDETIQIWNDVSLAVLWYVALVGCFAKVVYNREIGQGVLTMTKEERVNTYVEADVIKYFRKDKELMRTLPKTMGDLILPAQHLTIKFPDGLLKPDKEIWGEVKDFTVEISCILASELKVYADLSSELQCPSKAKLDESDLGLALADHKSRVAGRTYVPFNPEGLHPMARAFGEGLHTKIRTGVTNLLTKGWGDSDDNLMYVRYNYESSKRGSGRFSAVYQPDADVERLFHTNLYTDDPKREDVIAAGMVMALGDKDKTHTSLHQANSNSLYLANTGTRLLVQALHYANVTRVSVQKPPPPKLKLDKKGRINKKAAKPRKDFIKVVYLPEIQHVKERVAQPHWNGKGNPRKYTFKGRRRTQRVLKSDYFVNKQGQTITVDAIPDPTGGANDRVVFCIRKPKGWAADSQAS